MKNRLDTANEIIYPVFDHEDDDEIFAFDILVKQSNFSDKFKFILNGEVNFTFFKTEESNGSYYEFNFDMRAAKRIVEILSFYIKEAEHDN